MNISTELESLPNWQEMNAYDRALACCQLLSSLSQPIPGWMQIRQWIGKGSANDIHRAKQDFVNARHQALPEAFAHGVPPALSGSINDWWQQLRAAAAAEYDEQVNDWQLRLEQARQATEHSDHQRRMIEEKVQQLHEKISELQDQLHQQKNKVRQAEDALLRADTLRHSQEQQVITLTAQHAALIEQLTTQIDTQQQTREQQVLATLAQVEGLQQFATDQIEQTRQESRQTQQRDQQREQAFEQVLNEQKHQQIAFEKQLLQRLAPSTPTTKPKRKRPSSRAMPTLTEWFDH